MGLDSVNKLTQEAYNRSANNSGVSIYKQDNNINLETEIEVNKKEFKSNFEKEISEKNNEILKLKERIKFLELENIDKQNNIDKLLERNSELEKKVIKLYNGNKVMSDAYFNSQQTIEELKNKAIKYDLFYENQKKGRKEKKLKYSDYELYLLNKNKGITIDGLSKICKCSISTIKNRIKRYRDTINKDINS